MDYLRKPFSAALQYYTSLPPINPSTLTGAIDVIVIERPSEDGSGTTELACTPFHVRFGKWQVLRPGDKKVNVLVNGEPIPFDMKIGEAGEAFFVFETTEEVPEDLLTSPLLDATKVGDENNAIEPPVGGCSSKDIDDANIYEMGINAAVQHAPKVPNVRAEPSYLDLSSPNFPESCVQSPSSSRSSSRSPSPSRFSNRPSRSTTPPTSVSGASPLPSPIPDRSSKKTASPSTFLLPTEPDFPHLADSKKGVEDDAPIPTNEHIDEQHEGITPTPKKSPPSRAATLSHALSAAAEKVAQVGDAPRKGVARSTSWLIPATRRRTQDAEDSLQGGPHDDADNGEDEKVMKGDLDRIYHENGGPQDEGGVLAPRPIYTEDVVLDTQGYNPQKQEDLEANHIDMVSSPSHASEPEAGAATARENFGEEHYLPPFDRAEDQNMVDFGSASEPRRSQSDPTANTSAPDAIIYTGPLSGKGKMLARASNVLDGSLARRRGFLASTGSGSALGGSVSLRPDDLSPLDLSASSPSDLSHPAFPFPDVSIEGNPKDHRTALYGRGGSEPPDIHSPLVDRQTQQEYSWEWGSFPQRSPIVAKHMPLAPMERAESSLRTVSHVDHDEGDAVEMSNTHEDAGPMRRASPEPEIFGAGGKLYPGSSTSSTAADIGLNTDKTTTFWVDIDSKQFVFELSLCGHLDRKDEVGDAQRFEDAKVSYKRFLEDESMVESENLVMRWNGVHISHRDASPLMNALSHWRNSASQAPVQSVPEFITTPPESPRQQPLVTISTPSSILPPIPEPEPLPLKAPVVHSRSLSWASWWRSKSDKDGVAKGAKIPAPKGGGRKTSSVALRDASPQRNDAPITAADPSLEAGQIPLKKVESSLPTSPPLPTQPPPPRKHYIKTLRLTSGQLKQLNLKKGVNTITFSLSSSGQIACTARIFVWDYQDPVVVSDIDGTITKSDALGHVFTMIGRDWTHVGVAKLYTDIAKNGYNIMYLTSRAIGQADSTRDYLKGIKQNDYHLPEGPVIMSPDRLMASLHREVIMKKPEVFKMACLRDIRGLYGSSIKTPFHAGFGNRITDALSYRSVNIPSSRIFTIDSNGEVKMELLELAGYKSSYIHMTDLVDQMFPPVHRKVASEFTDFNYWRLPIQVYEVPNLEPPSPALSARSDTSRLSRLAIGFGLRGKSSDQSLAEKSAKAAEKPPGTVPRVSSPLASPVLTANDPDEDLIGDGYSDRSRSVSPMIGERRDRRLSMPGSLHHEPADFHPEPGPEGDFEYGEPQEDEDPEDQAFNDELLATGEMDEIPYL